MRLHRIKLEELWMVSPNGGEPRQVTRNTWDIQSSFSWSPDGIGTYRSRGISRIFTKFL